jgi:hypothetical protein
MRYGTTEGKPWIETLPTQRGAPFTGRTFSRIHILASGGSVPTVGEIWADSDHAVESHAHGTDELLYVLRGAIEVNGRRVGRNELVFIASGEAYSARVISEEGSHVLRIVMGNGERGEEDPEYDGRTWEGTLTEEGFPELGMGRREEVTSQ